jgi:hypothetical protein
MSQTTVIDYSDVAPIEGALVSSHHDSVIKTVLAGAAAGLFPGRWCGQQAGQNIRTGRHPAVTTEVTGTHHGIVIYDGTREHALGSDPLYKQFTAAPVLKKGIIWVVTEQAITTFGPAAFARFAAGAGGSVLGRFRLDADTATAAAVPTGRFVSLAGAGERVKLEINLP